MKPLLLSVALATALGVGGVSSQTSTPAPPAKRPPAAPAAGAAAGPARTNIPYAEAKPILDALREDLLPEELRGMTPTQRQSAWLRFVTRHDGEIRARVLAGDEEAIVNFMMFGTSFTKQPRVTSRDVAGTGQAKVADLILGRIDDLMTGLLSPGANERMRFVRKTIEQNGIKLATPAGKDAARRYLIGILAQITEQVESYSSASEALQQKGDAQGSSALAASFFHSRGLATDTSILSDFAIEQALGGLRSGHLLAESGVRRVAIVGPGLDFTDQEAGYDFYPPQTLQPFAVADSLIRLRLAKVDELRVTTLDLNPRINQHLDGARQRARTAGAYTLQLPRNPEETWAPALVEYWRRFGDQVADPAEAAAVPEAFGKVEVRAIAVRPPAVLSITPRDVNIVLQRLDVAAVDQRWDVIIATSVLSYYDVFEQSLAMANLSRMLRPGGVLLSSDLISALPTTSLQLVGYTDVSYAEGKGDRVVWYQRQ